MAGVNKDTSDGNIHRDGSSVLMLYQFLLCVTIAGKII